MRSFLFGAITASLLAVTSASESHIVEVCTHTLAEPSTVTETVTVTQPPEYITTPPTPPAIVKTDAGKVTLVECNGLTTSVWVYPTGTHDSVDAAVAIYVDLTLIQVITVNIIVSIVEGDTITITSTKNVPPTYTPLLPAPPSVPETQPSQSAPTSTSLPGGLPFPSVPTIHNVQVGANGRLIYSPNQLKASVGDIIRFDFLGKNHTVTQSSLDTPCTSNGGFDTGFNQFNPTNQTGLFVKDFVVKTNRPLWFYCNQNLPVSHCAKGMVLGVNPAGKFDKFLRLALATGNTTAPSNGTIPIDGNVPTNGTLPTNGTTPTNSTASVNGAVIKKDRSIRGRTPTPMHWSA